MDQPRGTDDKRDTKDDVAVVSKKRKPVAVSKTTRQELDLSAKNLFCDHSGPLRTILGFLDPGLDWPTCRKVSTSWHKCILLTEKTLDGIKNKPSIWMGPVVLVNPKSPKRYEKKIKKDLKLARRTTKEEQNSFRLGSQKYARMNRRFRLPSLPPLEPFQNWVRTDGASDECGRFQPPRDDPDIVTARVRLLCRNVFHLLEETDPELRSPFFSFAGARWCVILQDDDDDSDNGFGMRLERWDPVSDGDHRCVRSDPAPSVPHDLTCTVRYNATFKALSKPIQKMRDDYQGSSSFVVQPISGPDSVDSYLDYEYLNKDILQFALGPPPACPHLRITVDLEFLGYGYAC